MAHSLENESFAICLQACDVEVLEVEAAEPSQAAAAGNLIFLQPGSLVKVKEVFSTDKSTIIRIYDFYEKNLAFENNLFVCLAPNLHKVAPPLWPFLIGIANPVARASFFRNHEAVALTLNLKFGDQVKATVEGISLNCVVRHIGLVSEIGPGFYFGLEITDPDPEPLQLDYLDFIGSYVPSRPEAAVIIPASWIELPEDPRRLQNSKDYLSKLFSSTVEKAKNELSNRTATLRRSKRKSPTKSDVQSNRSSWHTNYNYNILADPPAAAAVNPPITAVTMDRTVIGPNPSLRRDDDASDRSSSTKSSQLTNASTSSTTNSIRSTASASKKKSPLKPTTTILSLEDRDLVIIDRNDIKESVQNESEVIVVDNPRSVQNQANTSNEVDLMDILGKDWPALAGDTAHVLNSTERRSNGQPIKPNLGELTTRNKSMNIISHLKNTKGNSLPRGSALNGSSHGYYGGSANSSMESSHSEPVVAGYKKKSIDGPTYDNLPSNGSEELNMMSPPEEEFNPVPLSEVPNSKLGLGSMVEVQLKNAPSLYGVIQWIGLTAPENLNSCLVGVELEDEPPESVQVALSDGVYSGVRCFRCPPNRAIFISPSKCSKDRRFQDQPSTSKGPNKQVDNYKMFGQKDCPVVPGFVPPLKILAPSDLEKVCGKFKGIQGHHNSCYLDATLFSMFTFTSVFDSLLFRPPDSNDISHYEEVQTVLRDEIVNPLRKNLFVRADRVMKLRKLLDRLSSVTGLLTEEKDPEEFLNSLLAQILRVQPFLKLNSGQDAYFYQLFVEKDERLSFPSVQQLFEQSFLASDIKLKEVPSCLIIQMPRFGKNYKLYPRILPSLVLDVTHIIEDSPRPCSVCNNLALFECKDCFGTMNCVDDFESTAFCAGCLERTHSVTRQDHNTRPLSVPEDFRRMTANNCITVPHLFMELFAVVCIETSHYVAFVKAGSGPDAPWCFFDSMADRKGGQNGYNIPEMLSVSELAQWLSEDGARELNESFTNDKMLPEHAKRLFCDAYMCMYQSSDIMMYR